MSAVLLVQSDWYEALKEENGKAWITLKKRGERGDHSFIKDTGDTIRVTSDNFEVHSISDRIFEVSHRETDLTFKVVHPVATFSNIHSKTLTNLDVSNGGIGVSTEGTKIFIWESATGTVRRCLEGHLADIYTCKLFPSGVVILSGGADMSLKVWCAETGTCARDLRGSKAAVVDTVSVEKGMNFVSVGRDGFVQLWSPSKAQIIEPQVKVDDTLTCCAIETFKRNPMSQAGDVPVPEIEVGTEDKVVAVGGENGLVAIIQIMDRDVVNQIKLDSGVTCLKYLTNELLLVGCENGSLVLLDAASLKIVTNIHDSDSPVSSLCKTSSGGFIVGRQDGSCLFYNSATNCRTVLSGTDVDPIYGITIAEDYVYTGARDGKIRKYDLKEVLS